MMVMNTTLSSRSPITLLNDVLGRWVTYRWQAAAYTEDEVDLTFFQNAIAASTLLPREKEVLILRYWNGWTFKAIGQKYLVGPQRAQQINRFAIRRMRQPANLRTLCRAVVGIRPRSSD